MKLLASAFHIDPIFQHPVDTHDTCQFNYNTLFLTFMLCYMKIWFCIIITGYISGRFFWSLGSWMGLKNTQIQFQVNEEGGLRASFQTSCASTGSSPAGFWPSPHPRSGSSQAQDQLRPDGCPAHLDHPLLLLPSPALLLQQKTSLSCYCCSSSSAASPPSSSTSRRASPSSWFPLPSGPLPSFAWSGTKPSSQKSPLQNSSNILEQKMRLFSFQLEQRPISTRVVGVREVQLQELMWSDRLGQLLLIDWDWTPTEAAAHAASNLHSARSPLISEENLRKISIGKCLKSQRWVYTEDDGYTWMCT